MRSPNRGLAAVRMLLAAGGMVALPGNVSAQVFTPAQTLTTTAMGYQVPQVCTWDADVHVVWVDAEAGGVRYQRSLDGGDSFGPERGLGSERDRKSVV